MVDAVALHMEEGFQTLILCVKLKQSDVREDTIDHVWKQLRDHLPQYALPDSVVPVANVPVTKHGKNFIYYKDNKD